MEVKNQTEGIAAVENGDDKINIFNKQTTIQRKEAMFQKLS